MSAFEQLGRLMRVVPGQAGDPAEDHRVLTLFRNRAELKKAYADLQDEVYRLKDRVKQQEGATARVQDQLAALQERLGLVETAYPAMVFYQLRGLWQRGREILEQFTADLAGQLEERERRALLAAFNARQAVRREVLSRNLAAAAADHAAIRRVAEELAYQRSRLNQFWHYFRRRHVDRRLQETRIAVVQAATALEQARAISEGLEQEPPPPFPGLTVEARRAVNLAVIVYAQTLCLRLADTPLVKLAGEAMARREAVDDYGDRKECEALIALIAHARARIGSRRGVAQAVKEGAGRLRPVVRYRSDTETVPTAASVAQAAVPAAGDDAANRDAAGAFVPPPPDVLAADVWDLSRVVLR